MPRTVLALLRVPKDRTDTLDRLVSDFRQYRRSVPVVIRDQAAGKLQHVYRAGVVLYARADVSPTAAEAAKTSPLYVEQFGYPRPGLASVQIVDRRPGRGFRTFAEKDAINSDRRAVTAHWTAHAERYAEQGLSAVHLLIALNDARRSDPGVTVGQLFGNMGGNGAGVSKFSESGVDQAEADAYVLQSHFDEFAPQFRRMGVNSGERLVDAYRKMKDGRPELTTEEFLAGR